MASSYIPPYPRNKPAPTLEQDALSTQVAKPSAVGSWNPQERSDDDLYTLQKIHIYFRGKDAVYEDTHSAVLHASTENPNGLSWVQLYNGANPKWNEDGVVFVKSNLDLLPVIAPPPEPKPTVGVAAPGQHLDEAGEDGGVKIPTNSEATDDEQSQNPSNETNEPAATTPSSSQPNEGAPVDRSPIAIFSQPIRRASRSFKFIGWYKIDRLQLLEPESEELIRMLMKKWETVDKYGRVVPRKRGASKWEESMSCKWAVVKMEKDKEATRNKGEPEIERWEEHDHTTGRSGGQSANEMLAEMRFEDGNQEVQHESEKT